MVGPNRALAADQVARVTIIYDAFGRKANLTKDWGYAALVEIGGHRILFDTGKDRFVFQHNVDTLEIDLTDVDFAVVSHRHTDHVSGISHLIAVNPGVKIYAPKESFGIFGSSLPSTFYRKMGSLPVEQRYYGGTPPAEVIFGSLWPKANITAIDRTMEVAPGVHLIALGTEQGGPHDLHEISLAMQTEEGIVLIVGCSHPGIARILDVASKLDERILMIVGGLHFAAASDSEIVDMIILLKEKYRVKGIAPGHCTGEPTFAALSEAFGKNRLYAGLGEIIQLRSATSNLRTEG